jgi:hypothetical protein
LFEPSSRDLFQAFEQIPSIIPRRWSLLYGEAVQSNRSRSAQTNPQTTAQPRASERFSGLAGAHRSLVDIDAHPSTFLIRIKDVPLTYADCSRRRSFQIEMH